MYRALARFIRNRSVGVAGTCLAIGALISAPALAAHMGGTERNSAVDDASSSSLQSRIRVELHAGGRDDAVAPRAQKTSAAVGLSRAPAPEEGGTQEAKNLPAHEVMTDSIGDFPDFVSPGVGAQPAEPRTINARIPGLSDDSLARFKNRMYRKDI